MKYNHVVFDVDGTLINNEEAVLLSMRQTVEQVTGRHMELDSLRFALGIPGVESLEKLGVSNPQAAIELWAGLFSKYDASVTLFDGILDTLSGLREKGIAMGVITSKTKAEYQVEVTGKYPELVPFFGCIVCSDDVELPKPNPDSMLHYMKETGAIPEEILYIGDSVYDYGCASGAGVDFGLAVWGAKSVQDRQASHFFRHPSDILRLYSKETQTAKS